MDERQLPSSELTYGDVYERNWVSHSTTNWRLLTIILAMSERTFQSRSFMCDTSWPLVHNSKSEEWVKVHTDFCPRKQLCYTNDSWFKLRSLGVTCYKTIEDQYTTFYVTLFISAFEVNIKILKDLGKKCEGLHLKRLPELVVHIYNSRTWEAEFGGSWVQI